MRVKRARVQTIIRGIHEIIIRQPILALRVGIRVSTTTLGSNKLRAVRMSRLVTPLLTKRRVSLRRVRRTIRITASLAIRRRTDRVARILVRRINRLAEVQRTVRRRLILRIRTIRLGMGLIKPREVGKMH